VRPGFRERDCREELADRAGAKPTRGRIDSR